MLVVCSSWYCTSTYIYRRIHIINIIHTTIRYIYVPVPNERCMHRIKWNSRNTEGYDEEGIACINICAGKSTVRILAKGCRHVHIFDLFMQIFQKYFCFLFAESVAESLGKICVWACFFIRFVWFFQKIDLMETKRLAFTSFFFFLETTGKKISNRNTESLLFFFTLIYVIAKVKFSF